MTTFVLVRCADHCGRRVRCSKRGGYRYCSDCRKRRKEAARIRHAERQVTRRAILREEALERIEAESHEPVELVRLSIPERLDIIHQWMRETA